MRCTLSFLLQAGVSDFRSIRRCSIRQIRESRLIHSIRSIRLIHSSFPNDFRCSIHSIRSCLIRPVSPASPASYPSQDSRRRNLSPIHSSCRRVTHSNRWIRLNHSIHSFH
jgi:hypothetical protein